MQKYADVLLPLPLYGHFTYSVPDAMVPDIHSGVSVYVPFGNRKYYTGIVVNIHDRKPSGYQVKPIVAILDSRPLVVYPQIKFWQWIADYYLCTAGEVFKAAVPTGLKVESETTVISVPDFEMPDDGRLTERQSVVLQFVGHEGKMSVDAIERASGLKNVAATVSQLLSMGAVELTEKAVVRYKARTENMLRLGIRHGDTEALHRLFDMVSRSVRQERLLVAYLEKSGWMHQEEPSEVRRADIAEVEGASPSVLKAMIDKGIFSVYKRSVNRFKEIPAGGIDHKLAYLSEAQQTALAGIRSSMVNNAVTLLHGVTGSGKTEVYTHLMDEALKGQRQVLFLVPEISLTTQLTDRLRKVFGERLLVYHSKFSDNERVDIWRRLSSTFEPLVVLGVRSSVFLPFRNLGLVIVDEEHEASYKQYDPAPRYNARDAAIVLATMHGAKVLLGSATPSVETYWKALGGKYGLVRLDERFEGAVLPEVEIVDMREQRRQKTADGILSAPMKHDIARTLKDGRQVIMFQNRRGFAPVVVCRECGWTPKCVSCDVSLVYHKKQGLLRCHYCGHSAPLPQLCPACGQNAIETFGYGTERIAEEMQARFADCRVGRMDVDTTRNKDSYHEIIEEFASHKTDMLVGTQMVTKGLDFDNVGLVGVLNADTMLNFPDFRSNERAFNMLEQVAGRAGRRDDQGKVVIQTTSPSEDIFSYLKAHDYAGYYKSEIADREKYGYPPFTRVINIYVKHRESALADSIAVRYVLELRKIFGQRVLGPEKPFVSRVSNFYLQSAMLKVEAGASMKKVKDILRQVYASLASEPGMKQAVIYYDVDPV